MRSPREIALMITLIYAIVLTGCAGKVRYPTYYTLHLPAAPDPPPGSPAHGSVAIREFRSPGYLRQGPLVYRTSPEQVGFYDYHRWATDPRQFVTNSIVGRLRDSRKFAEVTVYDGRSPVDYLISGRLEKLEEVDYDGGVKVDVALSAQMTDLRTGTTIWANSASESTKVVQRSVPAVVNQMSQTMDRAIEKLLSSIPNPPLSSR